VTEPAQGPPRDAKGRVLPGYSLNPDGRTKIASSIKDLARVHGPRAIERLVQHMESESADVSIRACVALLDRGFGKPAQVLSGPDDGPIQVDHDASKLSAKARELLEALLGRDGSSDASA
jgi:hypothetical protein